MDPRYVIRLSSVYGATSGTNAIFARFAAAMIPRSSSGGQPGIITPEIPRDAISLMNFSTPYVNTGLICVIVPVLQVRDNGAGIPAENLDKVFVPFFSTKEGGSGIGLSLSRQIIQLHNGTISVSSRPGEETVFTLRFRM